MSGPWRHRGVSANGIRLHVAECGDGPLVVLAHGFPEFWWCWRQQLVGLAEAGFRTVAVDLRGYGDSDKPPRGYDLWTLSGDLGGLIRALGAREAAVVGHGWGGLVGWTLAALHPRLVRSLAVLGAPHPLALRRAVWTDPRGQGAAVARFAAGFQVPMWPERSLRADGAARVERLVRSLAGSSWVASPEFAEVAARTRRAMLIPGVAHCSLEYFRWAVRSQARPDGRRFASAVSRPVRAPVLAVRGVDDPLVSERAVRGSARWVAGEYRYVPLAGCGHFPHQEAPGATTALLVEFLRSDEIRDSP
ncbi:alpha/beta fold hydrolase [Pseudonocardia acaciae]|uniref:alpha/beta fold hydrolase n=1 Tax=Pseudonocardia acaciae TaxID=551276 RepID=UPI001FE06076|nr:alpha/beta hydrolase [Pseudonocardia acaciae]